MVSFLLLALAVHRTVAARLASIWAYVVLGSSVIMVEEVAPVLAGFAARQNHLPVIRTVVACALGGWFASLAPYLVGRYGATALLRRFPKAKEAVSGFTGIVARRPWRAALASRFLFGARTLIPLACGTAHVRRFPFLVGTAISAAAWATIFFTLGWISGDAVLLLMGRVRRHQWLIALVLALIVAVVLLIVQRRNKAHVAEELGGRK
jgi:membrane protein DedA with SNARE-associated domain